jgi:N-formylglutamate amidohydrolase
MPGRFFEGSRPDLVVAASNRSTRMTHTRTLAVALVLASGSAHAQWDPFNGEWGKSTRPTSA